MAWRDVRTPATRDSLSLLLGCKAALLC